MCLCGTNACVVGKRWVPSFLVAAFYLVKVVLGHGHLKQFVARRTSSLPFWFIEIRFRETLIDYAWFALATVFSFRCYLPPTGSVLHLAIHLILADWNLTQWLELAVLDLRHVMLSYMDAYITLKWWVLFSKTLNSRQNRSFILTRVNWWHLIYNATLTVRGMLFSSSCPPTESFCINWLLERKKKPSVLSNEIEYQ